MQQEEMQVFIFLLLLAAYCLPLGSFTLSWVTRRRWNNVCSCEPVVLPSLFPLSTLFWTDLKKINKYERWNRREETDGAEVNTLVTRRQLRSVAQISRKRQNLLKCKCWPNTRAGTTNWKRPVGLMLTRPAAVCAWLAVFGVFIRCVYHQGRDTLFKSVYISSSPTDLPP